MSRLTEKDWKSKCAGYTWNVHPVKDIDDLQYYKKLAEYEDAEEQGKLLKFPIDENTPVYSIEYCCGNNRNNKSGMCHKGFCENCNDKSYYIEIGKAKQCALSEIGKSVFFTQEQADDALQKIKNS